MSKRSAPKRTKRSGKRAGSGAKKRSGKKKKATRSHRGTEARRIGGVGKKSKARGGKKGAVKKARHRVIDVTRTAGSRGPAPASAGGGTRKVDRPPAAILPSDVPDSESSDRDSECLKLPRRFTQCWVESDPHPIAAKLREFSLTPKQMLFVLHYVTRAGGNGAAAARMAGYPPPAARVAASENLTKPNIAAARLAIARMLVPAGAADDLLTSVLYDAAMVARRPSKIEFVEILDEEGKGTGEYKELRAEGDLDFGARIKAAEKLKALGEGRRSEDVGRVGINVVVQQLGGLATAADREHPGYFPAKDEGEGSTDGAD